MSAFVTAGAGFLLAVLWFDLMFDTQVLGLGAETGRGAVLPEPLLASIAAYYARVTTAARPMNRLVAGVMLATLTALVLQLLDSHEQTWIPVVSLVLALAAIGLAGARTVPSAVRLGKRRDSPERQSTLARAILRQHLLCAGAITGVLIVQFGFAQ